WPKWAFACLGRSATRGSKRENSMLHITNGDSTAISLRRSGIPGVFLAWRDVLHDGPAPAGLRLRQLSEGRARFLAERGWSSYEDALEEFRARDSILER